jgi:hypothetical protein
MNFHLYCQPSYSSGVDTGGGVKTEKRSFKDICGKLRVGIPGEDRAIIDTPKLIKVQALGRLISELTHPRTF